MLVSGDRVFHPYHGAGFVKEVEILQIAGAPQEYYNIFILANSLSVYVPTRDSEKTGLRKLSSAEQLEEAQNLFFADSAKLPVGSTERKNMFKNKLQSGTSADLYGILRDILCSKQHETKLTADDKHTMDHIVHVLKSELMMIKDLTPDEAEQLMKDDIERRSATFG